MKKERRYDIDWLRVLATLTIFLFHCARFFDTTGWHLKNPQRSKFATQFVILLALWEMPLFFLLSGVGSWYALKSRDGGQYIFERVKRLLIPFYTVGIFLLLPPQMYIDRLSHGQSVRDFWELVPPYFRGNSFKFLFSTPYLTNIWPGHLWFLQLLFNVCLLTLPILIYLRSEPGQRFIARLAGWCNRWGGIFLFLVPLLLVRFCLRGRFEAADYPQTWIDVFEYAVFFLIGYLIPSDKRFTESARKHGWVCLVLGIAGYVGIMGIYTKLGPNLLKGTSFSWTYVLSQIMWTAASWSWIVFVLSLGARYLNFNNRVLAYANEAVLPFYILHQTVILLVGRYVIPLELPILPKYLLVSAGSFVLIMAIYQLLIRWFNPMRFLFGMRPRKQGRQT
jgi:glucan biosynthesis protein C